LPLHFRIDREAEIVWTWAEGTVTADDLVEHARALTKTPDRPRWELADFSDRAEIPVATETVRAVAGLLSREDVNRPGSRLALVAGNEAMFGMLRLFEAYREHSNVEICVFRDREEALRWLADRPPAGDVR